MVTQVFLGLLERPELVFNYLKLVDFEELMGRDLCTVDDEPLTQKVVDIVWVTDNVYRRIMLLRHL
jgi:hypothetical protein